MRIENIKEPIMTVEESMTNFFGDKFLVIKPAQTKDELIEKEEKNTFDSKLSLDMDKERFESFKQEYGLKFFYEREGVLDSSYLFFLTPTNHIIKVSKYTELINTPEQTNYSYKIFNIIDSEGSIETLQDVLDIIKTPTKINPEIILEKIFKNNFYCFPSNNLNYDAILTEINDTQKSEVDFDFLKKYVENKIQEYMILSVNVNKPEYGKYYKRINVTGDYSYSERPVRITNVTDTMVYYKYEDTVAHSENACELHNFDQYFEATDKTYDKMESLIDSALCYFLDKDLITNICKGNDKKQVEMRPLELSDGALQGIYLSNDVGELYIPSSSIIDIVSLSYVVNRNIHTKKERDITFGINLDLPYILNEIEPNSLTKEQISKLSRQFESAVKIIDKMLMETKKSGMVSKEYYESTLSKVQNNIDLLSNNWEKICLRISDYEQNKDDYDYES